MELFWIGAAILLLVWAGIASARLACYEKQLRYIYNELQIAEQTETNILFTSAVPIGKTEEIISAFNHIMEHNRRIKERLIRENQSYRESITSISHDIRTPLTSAKGYLQMLCNNDVPEAAKHEYTKIVVRRLDDLAGMLDQLFLYTRIEAGELSLVMEELNAGNLFAETVSLFYEDFTAKNCEPVICITQAPCRIHADRQAFVRIIENLIKNALVHGTSGYELSLRQEEQEVVICVSNKTESILPEDIECIFDRFYTTDKTRNRKMTGLGLAIVKQLATQMDGRTRAWFDGDIFSIEVRFPLY